MALPVLPAPGVPHDATLRAGGPARVVGGGAVRVVVGGGRVGGGVAVALRRRGLGRDRVRVQALHPGERLPLAVQQDHAPGSSADRLGRLAPPPARSLDGLEPAGPDAAVGQDGQEHALLIRGPPAGGGLQQVSHVFPLSFFFPFFAGAPCACFFCGGNEGN